MKYLDEINHIKKLISSGDKQNSELAGELLNKIYFKNPQDYFLENFYGAYLALDSNKADIAQEKFKKSIECEILLKNAISLDIYNLHYKNLLGQTYIKLKKYDEAINLYNIVLKDWMENAEIYYYLGFAYKCKEEYEKAIFFLDKSISLGINFAQAYIYLSVCYEKTQSNYYSNLELTTKGVKLFNVSALDILHAENLFKFGEIEQGFEYLKKNISFNDNLNFISLYLFYLNYKSENIVGEYLSLVSVFKNKYLLSKKFKKRNHQLIEKPKKIKLGFISYDFRDHVVMYQLFDVIKELYGDGNFVLYAYYNILFLLVY